jgi:hypothetical protein
MVDIEYIEDIIKMPDTTSVTYIIQRSIEDIKKNVQENKLLIERLNLYLLKTDKTNIELAEDFRSKFSEIELPFNFEFDYLTKKFDTLEADFCTDTNDELTEEEKFSRLLAKQEANNSYFIQLLRKTICKYSDIENRRIIMQGRFAKLNSVMFKITRQLDLSTEDIINKIIDLRSQGKLLKEICQILEDEVKNPEITSVLNEDLLSTWIRRHTHKYPQLRDTIIPNDLKFARLEQDEKEKYINHINSKLAKYNTYGEILESLSNLGFNITYYSLIQWIRRTQKKESVFKFPADWQSKIISRTGQERAYITPDMFPAIDSILEEYDFNVSVAARFLKEMAVVPEDYNLKSLHSLIERYADHFVKYYDHLQKQTQVKEELVSQVINVANNLKEKGVVLPSKHINFSNLPFEVQSVITKMIQHGFKGKKIRKFLIEGKLYSEETCPPRQKIEQYINYINSSEIES